MDRVRTKSGPTMCFYKKFISNIMKIKIHVMKVIGWKKM